MWQLPKEKTQPIYQEIIQLLLSNIRNGNLLPGERLPSERKLANLFGVNRSTVVHALEELAATGILIRKQGSGTQVNEGKWGVYTGTKVDWRHYLSGASFQRNSPYIEMVEEVLKQESRQVIDAYTGEMPMDWIPSLQLPKLNWKEILMEEKFQDDLGYIPLRKCICTYLKTEYEMKIPENQLMITSGAQQALFLLIQVLLKEGDWVAIEEPSSFYPLSVFQAAGIRLYGVAVTEEGIDLDGLKQGILRHKVKMVLVNPSFQNPTGKTMSMQRREALVQLCRDYQIPIIEDDVFGQLYFNKKDKMLPLKKMDPENVIYIGSLSKVLGATTKIGWVSAPMQVLSKLAEARKEMDATLSIFPQVMATYALEDPNYEKHLWILRHKLETRCAEIAEVFRKESDPSFSFEKPKGGYYLWVNLPFNKKMGIKEMREILDVGVAVLPDFVYGVKTNAVRINFSRLSPKMAKTLCEKINTILLNQERG